jgi:hypothetical protein
MDQKPRGGRVGGIGGDLTELSKPIALCLLYIIMIFYKRKENITVKQG